MALASFCFCYYLIAIEAVEKLPQIRGQLVNEDQRYGGEGWCMCVCVCVCERERERESWKSHALFAFIHVKDMRLHTETT